MPYLMAQQLPTGSKRREMTITIVLSASKRGSSSQCFQLVLEVEQGPYALIVDR